MVCCWWLITVTATVTVVISAAAKALSKAASEYSAKTIITITGTTKAVIAPITSVITTESTHCEFSFPICPVINYMWTRQMCDNLMNLVHVRFI